MASHPILTSPGFLRAFRAWAGVVGAKQAPRAEVLPAVPGQPGVRVALYSARGGVPVGLITIREGKWTLIAGRMGSPEAWGGTVDEAEAEAERRRAQRTDAWLNRLVEVERRGGTEAALLEVIRDVPRR